MPRRWTRESRNAGERLFDSRQRLWRADLPESVRAVAGICDAEIASLIAPRALIVDTARAEG